jgi:hypothetical protein
MVGKGIALESSVEIAPGGSSKKLGGSFPAKDPGSVNCAIRCAVGVSIGQWVPAQRVLKVRGWLRGQSQTHEWQQLMRWPSMLQEISGEKEMACAGDVVVGEPTPVNPNPVSSAGPRKTTDPWIPRAGRS